MLPFVFLKGDIDTYSSMCIEYVWRNKLLSLVGLRDWKENSLFIGYPSVTKTF